MILVALNYLCVQCDLLAGFTIDLLTDYLANLRGSLDLDSSGLYPLFGHDFW